MQSKTIFILFLLFFIGKNGFTQPGCTDPQANNFDPNATMNNGSCEYPTTNYSLQEIAILPNTVFETSGLAFFDDELWTHNDGGNEDKIYQIDTLTGAVLKTIIIANSENIDWEDMAEDDTHVYIGDFGNNGGNRMDLKIYKFPKSQLGTGIATAEVIEFSYEDQTDFSINHNNHDYDCESFFFLNDSLHLFSKNWVDQKTRHYVIPSEPGTYVASLRESVDVQGYITGADISDDGVVALVGYNPSGVNILWIYFDYQGTSFFSGNKRKISLGLALDNSQTEAIVFRKNGFGYISSEQFANLDAKLLSFETDQWTNGMSTSIAELDKPKAPFKIYPNPVLEDVNILLEKDGTFEISLFDINRRLIKKENVQGRGVLNWNLENINLSEGLYFISIKNDDNVWVKKVQYFKQK